LNKSACDRGKRRPRWPVSGLPGSEFFLWSAIARGQHVKNRVFFIDEQTAVAAGDRPCAVCLPDEFAQWKEWNSGRVGAGADAQ